MRVEVVESLAEPVGRLWMDRQSKAVSAKGSFTIAVPLSSTPLSIYDWVVSNAHLFDAWPRVEFVLMDEQIDEVADGSLEYVPLNDSASYEGFARRHFIHPLEQKTNVRVPISKPDANQIAACGLSTDLLILALGVSGNYANVMPGTSLDTGWHIAELLPEYRQAHTSADSDSYAGANFRAKGMSLGPQQVMNAGEVVVIISGARKQSLAERLFAYDTFDPQFPLSILHHEGVSPKVTVILDYATGYDPQHAGSFRHS